jgi:hypothetical protein
MKAVLVTLAEFLRTGLRPQTPLAKAITLALAVKLIAIVAIWLAFFSGNPRPPTDASAMARLIGPSAPPP